MSVDSQATMLLGYLRDHPEGITALEALRTIGTLRLAARVSDLRAAGNRIESEMVTVAGGKRVARYRLLEPTLWGTRP